MRICLLPVFILFFAACNSDTPTTESSGATHITDAEDHGRALFQQHCATCHNMVKDVSGPALAGVLQRWNNDTARLKAFIRNPARLIREGDPSAVKTAAAFKPTVMTGFPNLSDKDLNHLIAFIRN